MGHIEHRKQWGRKLSHLDRLALNPRSIRTTLLFFFDEVHGWTDLQLDKASASGGPELGRSGRLWWRGRRFFLGLGVHVDDREILARHGANQRPNRSSVFPTNVREGRFRDPILKAVHPKAIQAASRRNRGRADGHTAAKFGGDCERDEDQEHGDQEFHGTPTVRL